MKQTAAADIVIFGGGVAGLWLLNRLRQAGFSTLLFESNTLGGGQTNKSQGIIHGGMKYALQGVFTQESQMLAQMPMLWKDCLSGVGELDLSQVPVLSSQQYLWSPHSFTSKLTGFLASKTLSSKVTATLRDDYPAIFCHPTFKGELFSLDEMVIDVPILVRELVKASYDAVFKIEPIAEKDIHLDENGRCLSATINMAGKSLEVKAQHFIFTAGAGNESIIKKLNKPTLAMQRRPLHMVLVKTPFNYPLYAHCLGLGARPRLTITTHYTKEGSTIWYLGGQLAEEGIHRHSEAQIKAASGELQLLFPWLDFTKASFSTFMVDRAESHQKTGLKPESTYTKMINNMIIAWPTKLALAPILAADILEHLKKAERKAQLFDARELRAWPMPPLAKPIWEDLFCKNVA